MDYLLRSWLCKQALMTTVTTIAILIPYKMEMKEEKSSMFLNNPGVSGGVCPFIGNQDLIKQVIQFFVNRLELRMRHMPRN